MLEIIVPLHNNGHFVMLHVILLSQDKKNGGGFSADGRVPMKRRFVSTSPIEFGRSVYFFGRVIPGVFEDNQLHVYTQQEIECSERLVAANRIYLPLNRNVYKGVCLSNC